MLLCYLILQPATFAGLFWGAAPQASARPAPGARVERDEIGVAVMDGVAPPAPFSPQGAG
jgi:hypothetical protein